jgi:hypothetical protein
MFGLWPDDEMNETLFDLFDSMAPTLYGNGRFLYGEKGPTAFYVEPVTADVTVHKI